MKKLILTIALFVSVAAFSQTAYEKTMTEKISKLENTHSNQDLAALANDFSRIAEKEKTQWLPYYYAALAQLNEGRMLSNGKPAVAEIDALADASDKNIAKADELSPMNSEVYILKKMSHRLRMLADPMARFMSEGAAAKQALDMARKLNPGNPRIVLLDAEDTYFTPEQFGGSKEKGLELFQKALEMFKTYKPKSALEPNWGQSEAEYFLAQPK